MHKAAHEACLREKKECPRFRVAPEQFSPKKLFADNIDPLPTVVNGTGVVISRHK